MYMTQQENSRSAKTEKILYVCLLAYIFLILSLPDGIKNMTCLYKVTTKGVHVTYTYNYYFSLLEVPIILFGLLYYKYSKVIKFLKVYVIIFILNIIYYVIEYLNIVTLYSYESFLLLLTGFSAACIVLRNQNSLYDIEEILDCFTILQFLLQIVSMISGASGADGRYAAIGMGSGATASLACEYLIWTLFARQGTTRIFPMVCAVITVILSGSRTNLLAFIFIAVVFFGKLAKKQIEDGYGRRLFWITLIAVPIIVILIVVGVRNGGQEGIGRLLSLFEGNFAQNVSEDGSFLGRQRSIEGSFNMLRDHPAGIPFSVYAIEDLSSKYFSMEYPHSTLLSYVLLWSPVIAICCYIYIIRLFVKAIKLRDNSAVYLGYYLFILIFYGSPILYAKSYAFIFIVLSYIKNKLNDMETSYTIQS